ncbi:MAG: UvrD-helicase domain-containing protein [Syntrophobacterales bacterium]|jgi:DNA helicase-2/ATP-dependent DNA helicase PcrA|nr:UvrD-helicase domain-containing protein [Syntrophobacterales bacterium]
MTKRIVIAAAGSRKTTSLIEESILDLNLRALSLTYTIENYNEIRLCLTKKCGVIPGNIEVMTWYSFLLRECVRPYQNYVYDKKRIDSICFIEGQSTKFIPKANAEKYFFYKGNKIFTDKIAEFACRCNELSEGLVIRRLEAIYNKILIDEVQDLAGYDFDVLEMLLRSKINIYIVGDCRQSTYFTNCSPKNKQFKGQNIVNLFKAWEKLKLCSIVEKTECYRCNQYICDFADRLYPDMAKTISQNSFITGHDGIFIVKGDGIYDYYTKYHPIVLRDSKRTDTLGLSSINFGVSKGKSYDRVLIFPNGPIKEYLKNGDPSQLKPKTKSGFYVALTRARYSVAFAYDGKSCFDEIINEYIRY